MERQVRYLVDTNVWLESLLDREKSEITSMFFDLIPMESLFVSDFSIHSIGVILSRFKKTDVFEKFIAQKYDLTLITFDKDFNAKGIKKRTPDEIIEKL